MLRETTSRGLCGLGCPSKRGVCGSQVFASVCKLCVFITAVPISKLFARGGGGMEDMWYERLRVCVYYCRTYYKAVCGGGGGQ